MNFKLPAFLKELKLPSFSRSEQKIDAVFVIRNSRVECAWQEGAAVKHAQAALAGPGDFELAEAIRKLLEATGLKSPTVAVSISNQDVVTRFFSIPAIPKSERESAVQFEARKYVPFKIDSLVWDFRAIPFNASAGPAQQPTGDFLEVVFSAIPRETYARFQQAFTAAGLKLALVEPLSQSLFRLVSTEPPREARDFECVVDLSGSQAHLAIGRLGIAYLTRDIQVGASEASPALSAEQGGEDPFIKRLLSELSVSLTFFQRECPSAAIKRIVLIGDEMLVSRYCHELAPQLPCSIEPGNRSIKGFSELQVPLPMVAAAGLFLSGGNPKNEEPIDFLKRAGVGSSAAAGSQPSFVPPLNVSEVKTLLQAPQAMTTAAIIFAAITASLWVFGSSQLAVEQHRLDQLKQSQATGQQLFKDLDAASLKPIEEEANKQARLLKDLLNQRVSLASKLDGLARVLPNGVWLTTLVYENRLDVGGKVNKSAIKLVVNGACYLGESGRELSAIQEFENRIKHNAALLNGLEVAQLGKIDAGETTAGGQGVSYRTFQLNCQSAAKGKI